MTLVIPLWYLYAMPLGLACAVLVQGMLRAFHTHPMAAIVTCIMCTLLWPLLIALMIGAFLTGFFKRGHR